MAADHSDKRGSRNRVRNRVEGSRGYRESGSGDPDGDCQSVRTKKERKMRSGTLFLCLFLLIGARSAAAEFGSEKEGFTIRLTGDWKSVSLLSKLLDSETARLTAFRDLTGKTPLVVHILSTDGFGDLNFNRQAVVDAIRKLVDEGVYKEKLFS